MQLNKSQQEAVETTEGYVRVIAGAGSGKTKLLVSRYAYIVQNYGIDTANIMCVTFTNKAAAEMKKRIRNLIGDGYDTSLICTYHGFCARLLRDDSDKLFLPKEFQIIDKAQQKSIIAEIYQKYELKLDYASFEKIMKIIAEYKAKNAYEKIFCSGDKFYIENNENDLDTKIIEEYIQKQKSIYALDFNDLLNFAIYLLKNNSEVREKWQDRLNYIQVDEFQDSSVKEMYLIDILSEKYKNVLIVGDPDQNIYEWRGSNVELLVDFDKTHKDTKTIFLNQNYRSTPEILKCANTLIDKNQLRVKKDLFTKAKSGAKVLHIHSKSDYEEVEEIVKRIKNLQSTQGYAYSDIAVLYRSGFLSRIIEKKFVETGIPYEIYGGVRFYQRMEIQDIIAYLKLIAYQDDISFKRIANKPRRKFGRVKMVALEEMNSYEALDNENATLYSTLNKNINEDVFKGSSIKKLVDMVNGLSANKDTMKITDIVNAVCEKSGYQKYISELGDEERFENLTEFKRLASEFENNYGEDVKLEVFLQQLALQSNEDDEKKRDSVKMMTIHASKGLEFPGVFVVGMSESIFPSAKSIEERKEKGLEEERRLCYVAITRARHILFLMDSEGVMQNSTQKRPSRFLFEIGEENYERIGNISKDDVFSKQNNSYSQSVSSKKKIGDKIEHHIFGKGTITDTDPRTGGYKVEFENLSQPRYISSKYFDKQLDSPEKETGENLKSKKTIVAKKPEIIEIKPKEANNDRRVQTEKFLEETDNLWKRDDVPHSGWTCIDVTDLGGPFGVCQMCGYQVIRYVHTMKHPDFPAILGCGCICAGKMEGNIDAAKKREQEFKSKQAIMNRLKEKEFNRSSKGNYFLKYKKHLIVLYYREYDSIWKYSIDGVFCNIEFLSREEAEKAAFDAFAKLI